jgi:ribosomal protein S3
MSFLGQKGIATKRLRNSVQTECCLFRRDHFQYFCPPNTSNVPIRQPEIQIFVHQLTRSKVEACAHCLAYFIVTELQKRTTFRRIFRIAQERAQNLGQVLGLRFQISGRLNGADIARVEWIRRGRVPLHTFSASLDYSFKTAYTIYGLLGVKVWTFKKEERVKDLNFYIFYAKSKTC